MQIELNVNSRQAHVQSLKLTALAAKIFLGFTWIAIGYGQAVLHGLVSPLPQKIQWMRYDWSILVLCLITISLWVRYWLMTSTTDHDTGETFANDFAAVASWCTFFGCIGWLLFVDSYPLVTHLLRG